MEMQGAPTTINKYIYLKKDRLAKSCENGPYKLYFIKSFLFTLLFSVNQGKLRLKIIG